MVTNKAHLVFLIKALKSLVLLNKGVMHCKKDVNICKTALKVPLLTFF